LDNTRGGRSAISLTETLQLTIPWVSSAAGAAASHSFIDPRNRSSGMIRRIRLPQNVQSQASAIYACTDFVDLSGSAPLKGGGDRLMANVRPIATAKADSRERSRQWLSYATRFSN
jgi:hypothetical protein